MFELTLFLRSLFGQQGRQMRTDTEIKTDKLTMNPKKLKMSSVHSNPSQVESINIKKGNN